MRVVGTRPDDDDIRLLGRLAEEALAEAREQLARGDVTGARWWLAVARGLQDEHGRRLRRAEDLGGDFAFKT
jgi:hypothetical protein